MNKKVKLSGFKVKGKRPNKTIKFALNVKRPAKKKA